MSLKIFEEKWMLNSYSILPAFELFQDRDIQPRLNLSSTIFEKNIPEQGSG